MTAVSALIAVYVALALIYWARAAYGAFRVLRDLPPLHALSSPDPERWPSLSVIVPARNEEQGIEQGVAESGMQLLRIVRSLEVPEDREVAGVAACRGEVLYLLEQ